MALNQIGQERFQRRLTRELEIGGDQPSPVLAPEIQPVLVVEAERPELLHLQGEQRFYTSLTLAGVAAEYPYFFLINPAWSRAIVVVEEWQMVDGTATATGNAGWHNPTFVASLAGRAAMSLDSRIPQNAVGRPCMAEPMMGTDTNTGGVLNAYYAWRAVLNTNILHQAPWVVTPGHGFACWLDAVAQATVGYCIWRERPAKDGELT